MARLMHGALEPYTFRRVDGVVAVSPEYIATLRRRYPWLSDEACTVIPFGANASDFEAARHLEWRNPFFDARDGRIHAVAVGRGGRDMQPAANLLFGAIRCLQDRAQPLAPIHLWFVGTDYASGRGSHTLAPIAESAGVGAVVSEFPERQPYLEALRLLQDGHLTIILGSDDSAYSPSKVYPYLLAKKPFIAVVHEASPVVPLLLEAGTGVVATFGSGDDTMLTAPRLADKITRLLKSMPADAQVPASVLEPFMARELTRRQCGLFDLVLRRQALEGVTCAG
jgi:hypothetical protein